MTQTASGNPGSQTANVQSLFQTAASTGVLSPQGANALAVMNVGNDIQGALGTPVNDVHASAVILISVTLDDSGSIRMAGQAEYVRIGGNTLTDAMKGTKQQDGILMTFSLLNEVQPMCLFAKLKDVPKLTTKNYNPNGGTPLYDRVLTDLGLLVAKVQEFNDSGVPCRAVYVIASDGEDIHSVRAKAHHCKAVIHDLLKTENYIICAVGVDNEHTDFRKVFGEMGIEDRWIIVIDPNNPKGAEHEFRAAFNTVSQTAVRASQNAASFSQTAMGGFASP